MCVCVCVCVVVVATFPPSLFTPEGFYGIAVQLVERGSKPLQPSTAHCAVLHRCVVQGGPKSGATVFDCADI